MSLQNNVTLIGRFTNDPEKRVTQNGKSVTRFTLAVDRYGKDNGADFIVCIAWNQVSDYITTYLKKGDSLAVNGSIQTRNYDGTDGKKVYVTEVIVNQCHGFKKQNQQQINTTQNSQPTNAEQQTGYNDYEGMVNAEDLPF